MSKQESKEGAPQEGGDAAKKDANADLFENRGDKKIVRLITVAAYMFSVSFVGIALSGYYLFLWQPPNPKLIRRAHFKADPQIQFLMSDPMILPNQSRGHLSESSGHKFFNDIAREQKNSPNPQASLTGRIADDSFDVNDYAAMKKRDQLDQSLFILRNSLIELLRGKVNNSAGDRNSSRRNGETANVTNNGLTKQWIEITSSRDLGRMAPDFQTRSDETSTSKIEDSAVNDSSPSLTLDSSTISGDEVHKHRFTSSGNGTTYQSFRNVHQVDYSSTVNTGAGRGRDLNYASANNSNEVDSDIVKNSTRNNESIDESTYRNFINVTTLKPKTNPTDKRSIRSYVTTVRTIENRRPIVGITAMDIKKVETKENMQDRAIVDLSTSNQTIANFSRNVESGDRLEFPQRSNVSSGKPTSAAMNSEEVQIQKTTTNLMKIGEQLSRESKIVTTQRPKDLLTILTDIASTKPSMDPSLSVVSEDFRTESSTSTESHPETTT